MKAFRITPKRIRRSNGQVLTPEMSVVVSTNLSNPFNNGATEVAEELGIPRGRVSVHKTRAIETLSRL
ncbi:MAG: sigma factor-like helix-turn-helix DNA-binding protein [Bacteroidales bacterium]|nr:sigma factor-like helix-turn-helix DNA-binding protein [Bacteroidales bacterium]